MTEHNLSILFEVTDGAALVKAAREKAVQEGMGDWETVCEMIEDDDYRNAARWLFDPGMSPPGTEIIDTYCE